MTHLCDAVLVPSELRVKSDYSIAQAYAFTNAERDYEKLKSGQNVDQSLGLIYKVFSLDLSNSTSAQDFQERVRNRLTTMGFSMTASAAESHYRRGIEPFQADKWLECQAITAAAENNGASSRLFMYLKEVSPSAAIIQVMYRPGVGVTDHQLAIDLQDATIDGETSKLIAQGGAKDSTWIVTRGSAGNPALISAQAGGATSHLKIDFNHVPLTGGIVGDVITIARRAGASHLIPYEIWTPAEVDVTAFTPAIRWIAAGKEYMNISATRSAIHFEITEKSQFYDYGTPGFDGFVVRGFDSKFKKVTLKNNAPLIIDVREENQEVQVDIRGYAPPGTGFSLHFDFSQ